MSFENEYEAFIGQNDTRFIKFAYLRPPYRIAIEIDDIA
ncbi:hypothetical protein J2Z65_006850 [Paenibacillus aceris]|uniref:Uncharacterized protein n=1 Tax=Paenibacillus aceris TaxID=869555 RepID=A0ABS4I9I1_9BACL|nr:hypothetical protein [Paenibacillus aceris]